MLLSIPARALDVLLFAPRSASSVTSGLAIGRDAITFYQRGGSPLLIRTCKMPRRTVMPESGWTGVNTSPLSV
jgi:hypothetical protein